jgi:hypothetical protein
MPVPLHRKPDPALLAAWSRVSCYADKLFASLDELQDLGGTCKLAASARWSPEAHDRAAGQLLAVVEAAEAELGRLELRRRHFPTRGRRLG